MHRAYRIRLILLAYIFSKIQRQCADIYDMGTEDCATHFRIAGFHTDY